MKNIYKIIIWVLWILVVLCLVWAIVAFTHQKPVTPAVDTWSVAYLFSGYDTGTTDAVPVVPTTGSVTATFEQQPQNLPGNYQDNGTFLRAWALKNTQTLNIPDAVKDATITFELAKASRYTEIPGNIQLSVDGKTLCNGRLSLVGAIGSGNILTYNLNFITTQDHPKGFDASIAIGRTLSVMAWIWEAWNYLKSVTVNFNL